MLSIVRTGKKAGMDGEQYGGEAGDAKKKISWHEKRII